MATNEMGVLKKQWIVAFGLSLFVGSLGIDRFYLGRVGTGILKLITFGGFGIWWLIDVIMIGTKNMRNVVWVESDTKSDKKVALIMIAVYVALVFMGVIVAASSSESTTTTTTSSSNSNQSAQESTEASAQATDNTPGIGQPARDGKFEFVVKSVSCGQTSIGDEYLAATAQGQFCNLSVSVKNIGNEPQTMFVDNQYLFNSSNQKFSADSEATIYANPNSDTWIGEINPGNSIDGIMVFDIPKDQTPVVAELHDSAFSDGVKVNLQ